MTRRLPSTLLLTSLALAALSLGPAPAFADEPAAQGWWTATNPGGLPANPSSASDVPPDGLLLELGPTSPTAYAALGYFLADGETANRLTLKVAPNTVTTPSATIQVCPLTSPSFGSEQGGPISSAPQYDCTKKVMATLDSGGTTFTASVGSLVSDRTLAVALLPGDSTSRVVLSKPDASSLETTASPVVGPQVPITDGSTPDPAAPGSVGSGGSGVPPLQLAVPVQGPAVLPSPVSQSPVVATPSASPAPGPAIDVAPVAVASAHGSSMMPRVALGLLIGWSALAAVLWAFVGGSGSPTLAQPSRRPD